MGVGHEVEEALCSRTSATDTSYDTVSYWTNSDCACVLCRIRSQVIQSMVCYSHGGIVTVILSLAGSPEMNSVS